MPHADFDAFSLACAPAVVVAGRLGAPICEAYGTRADHLLGGANGINDLGQHFGDDLYGARSSISSTRNGP
jgi:glycerol-3-phosphate dehydrogenase